jgi:hypothetical protein
MYFSDLTRFLFAGLWEVLRRNNPESRTNPAVLAQLL